MLIHVDSAARSVVEAWLNSGSGASGKAQLWWVRLFYAMGVRCCGQLVMVDCGIIVGEEKGRERGRGKGREGRSTKKKKKAVVSIHHCKTCPRS